MGKRQSRSRIGQEFAIYRIVKVTHGASQFLCRAYSISDEEIKLLTGFELLLGTSLRIELSEGMNFFATVAAYSGARVGVRFDQPIDARAILKKTSQDPHARQARAARVPVDQHCAVYTPIGIRHCTVVDVSQAGAKIKHAGFLASGMKITLSLPVSVRRAGIVRWVSGELAGVQLLDCLSLEEIEALKRRETRH